MTAPRRPADFAAEPSIVEEDVERRGTPRGPRRDLAVVMPDGARVPVLEAGPRNIFVALDDPDGHPLGGRLAITIEGHGRRAAARAEVVRKEIQPRRGVALLLVHLAPAAEVDYRAMLGA